MSPIITAIPPPRISAAGWPLSKHASIRTPSLTDSGSKITSTKKNYASQGRRGLVPIAVPDVATTRENTEIMIDVLAGDTVPAGEKFMLTGVGNGANGMVTINGDGTLTYRPKDYWSGWDSFIYSLSDGKHGTTTGTVTVEVSAVADKSL